MDINYDLALTLTRKAHHAESTQFNYENEK